MEGRGSMQGRRLNFAAGPVMMDEDTCRIGGEQVPYFRTQGFSMVMKRNEELLTGLAGAGEGSRAVFLTGSGTAGMEMAVVNSFCSKDKVLVVNGGSFGERFGKICHIHGIPYEYVMLAPGEALERKHLEKYSGEGFTGMLVNMHETSTGVLYDMGLVGDFCKKNRLFLVVDAISAFMADTVEMEKWGIDVLVLSSQKALALPPGMSFLVLGRRAVERADRMETGSLYLQVSQYLEDGRRGQTPYTPAVGILLQLADRLEKVSAAGITSETGRVHNLAVYFREQLKDLPFRMFAQSPSSAVTALSPEDGRSARYYVDRLDRGYNIWACPNGGALADKVFRVGHMGDVHKEDYDVLVSALREIVEEEAVNG